MKKIEATIKPEKLEPVRSALAELGILGMWVYLRVLLSLPKNYVDLWRRVWVSMDPQSRALPTSMRAIFHY